jgi:aryl-alcohol dehydrogenase-like predicted oxidoreductase
MSILRTPSFHFETGVTAFYGDPLPTDKAMELFKTVYDEGLRHFDTAEIYAAGDLYNEAVLGEFLATVPRDSFSVATKFWPGKDDYSYDTVKPSLEASLKRLGLDYVDLYYAHRVTSLEGALDFCRTAKRLQEEGLIKEIGLSEVGGEWLRKCYAIVPIAAVQQEWSLVTRNL